jgi:hypothetical protein
MPNFYDGPPRRRRVQPPPAGGDAWGRALGGYPTPVSAVVPRLPSVSLPDLEPPTPQVTQHHVPIMPQPEPPSTATATPARASRGRRGRQLEYASKAALHHDLRAACDEYAAQSDGRRVPKLRHANDILGTLILPGKHTVCENTLRRAVKKYYGTWDEWLAVYEREKMSE